MNAINTSPQFYLASASPRRHELLQLLGLRFQRIVSEIDESVQPQEAPGQYVRRLALAKARAGQHVMITTHSDPQDLPVMGADTSVIIDQRILGKPQNRDDGLAMLELLSGREHQVMSAVALVRGEREKVCINISRVRFRELSKQERETYWATGEPADKAGGYGIQGIGAMFVAELQGSHSGVMGLPLYETAELLHDFDIDILK